MIILAGKNRWNLKKPGKGIGFITAVSENLSGCGYVRDIQGDEDYDGRKWNIFVSNKEEMNRTLRSPAIGGPTSA
jgi:hypothetical protein